MGYTVTSIEKSKTWTIDCDGQPIGVVERLSTGYLVTIADPPQKVKRYRMIDALQEALGEGESIEVKD